MKFTISEAIVLLDKTPGVLRQMLSGLPEEWVQSNEGPDTWSAKEVLSHLILGEETDWIERARIILNDEKDKMFEPFDMTSHVDRAKSESIEQLLKEFEKLRKDNLEQLDAMAITSTDLRKKGVHPEFGGVTLRELLSTWVVHDFTHISQISRIMAKQYEEEVGPWKHYLGILNR